MPSDRLRARRLRHEALSERLAAMSDEELSAALAPEAAAWRRGWGETATIEVDGEKVFVKKVALSDLERAHPGATANQLGLPLFYQYGVGSGGFGAWRELHAMLQASEWAASGACEQFLLVHHWRVLPRTPTPLPPEYRARVRGLVDYWDGSPAIAARLDGIFEAHAAITIVMEHVPETLDDWLRRVLGGAPGAAEEALIGRTLGELRAAAAFMNARGMQHFDLHAYNLLTDGEQLYVGDFGLALSDRFDLSPEERDFLEAHRDYDRCYIEWAFVAWLSSDPNLASEALATEPCLPELPPGVHALADRSRPVARVVGAFLDAVRARKTTSYPAAEFAAALAAGQQPPI